MLETYQKARIALIKEILPLIGDNFVLKGGTALSLFYGLDRYSEDLDFDAKSNNMDFTKQLKKHKSFADWNISIKKNTGVVFRAMLDYGANSHLGAYPLKIEVSNRNKSLLQNNLLEYSKINGVNVYGIKELINMKATAFSGRDKIRDFYDLGFLLKEYPKYFSRDNLLSIHQKITYAGEEELNLLLLEEVEKHKLVTNKEVQIDNYAKRILEQINTLIKQFSSKDDEKEECNQEDIRTMR